MKLTDRPAVTVTAMLTLGAHEVAEARLIVGSVGSVPFAADTTILLGAAPAGFAARAEACAGQAAAGCTPLSDGEASAEYLRHLVFIHARQALQDAFARASQPR
jgi:aerobic carbon-monoxide dehydrogenase medium subunit